MKNASIVASVCQRSPRGFVVLGTIQAVQRHLSWIDASKIRTVNLRFDRCCESLNRNPVRCTNLTPAVTRLCDSPRANAHNERKPDVPVQRDKSARSARRSAQYL